MISEHFSRSEFDCKCGCGQNTVDAELITVLEDVRNHFGVPVIVASGNRCLAYNEMVQSVDPDYIPFSSNSQHMYSKAADIIVQGITAIEVYKYLANKYVGKYGIGSYLTFTHIDVRVDAARW